jgi:hypothetical protein
MLTLEDDYRSAIQQTWEETKKPSRTYSTDNGRERGRRSYDVELAAKPLLEQRIQQEVTAAESFYNYTGRTPTRQSSVVLLYGEGVGCPIHCDDQDPADMDYGVGTVQFNWANQLVALLYLSTQGTDFEGGELYFPNPDLRIEPKYGMLVMFPAHYKYKHGVLPIVSGQRMLLQTTWRFDL